MSGCSVAFTVRPSVRQVPGPRAGDVVPRSHCSVSGCSVVSPPVRPSVRQVPRPRAGDVVPRSHPLHPRLQREPVLRLRRDDQVRPQAAVPRLARFVTPATAVTSGSSRKQPCLRPPTKVGFRIFFVGFRRIMKNMHGVCRILTFPIRC